MSDKTTALEQVVELPSMYFNGFQLGVTNSDVSGIMLLNGQPQLVMNLSYTTAKTLQQALSSIISDLEDVTGHEIMMTKEIDAGLRSKEAKA